MLELFCLKNRSQSPASCAVQFGLFKIYPAGMRTPDHLCFDLFGLLVTRRQVASFQAAISSVLANTFLRLGHLYELL